MTKPNKPLEAKGCGCGLLISVLATAWAISYLFKLGEETSLYIALGLAAVSIIVYEINEHKSQTVLDSDYREAKEKNSSKVNNDRDEISCPYCGEKILRIAIKCKHCGSKLSKNSTPEGPTLE